MIIPENEHDNYMIASQISDNLQSEWLAVSQYDLLIQWFKASNDDEAVDIIEEIISDEKNHAKRLQQLLWKYDGNIATAKH